MLKYSCSVRWVQWKYAPGHQQRLCWFDYGDIVWHRYHVTAIKQGMFHRRRRLASRWYHSHTGQTETKPTIKANFLMNRPAVGHRQRCWRHRKTSRVHVGLISGKIRYGIAQFDRCVGLAGVTGVWYLCYWRVVTGCDVENLSKKTRQNTRLKTCII